MYSGKTLRYLSILNATLVLVFTQSQPLKSDLGHIWTFRHPCPPPMRLTARYVARLKLNFL